MSETDEGLGILDDVTEQDDLADDDEPATAALPRVDAGQPAPQAESPAGGSVSVKQQAASALQVIDCPGCGTRGSVDPGRREATSFCRVCDYPLFWAIERIIPAGNGPTEGSLRRLPGTGGRQRLASLDCPNCTEPNSPSSIYCRRCGSLLRPEPVEAPTVVVEAAPLPEPEPLPEPGRPWWFWWLLGSIVFVLGLGVTLALVFAL